MCRGCVQKGLQAESAEEGAAGTDEPGSSTGRTGDGNSSCKGHQAKLGTAIASGWRSADGYAAMYLEGIIQSLFLDCELTETAQKKP